MNKLAVFVEGYTELVFVDALITHIAGENNIRIEQRQIRGGTSTDKRYEIIKAAKPDAGQRYYVLIVDCGGDRAVAQRIRDEHEKLTKNNYQRIIGLRDVRASQKFCVQGISC